MSGDLPLEVNPFGEADCESEIALLKDDYSKYYFYHTRFNISALNREVYLIIGRRGSGKTALAHYFSFQKRLRDPIAIDVDEPAAFQRVMEDIANSAARTREVAIPRIVKVWEFVIWSIIFRELRDKDPRIKTACIFGYEPGKVSGFIRNVLRALLGRVLSTTDREISDELEKIVGDAKIQAGKKAVLELAEKSSIIISIDTLENYAVHDESMMRATAGLIQCGSEFSRDYASNNTSGRI